MTGKRVGQTSGESIGGVAPQVLRMVPAVHAFLIIKLFNGYSLFAVGKTYQNMRQSQADISGVVALAEHIPLQIGLIVEDLFQIARARQFGEAFEVEQSRRGGSDKGRMRSRS